PGEIDRAAGRQRPRRLLPGHGSLAAWREGGGKEVLRPGRRLDGEERTPGSGAPSVPHRGGRVARDQGGDEALTRRLVAKGDRHDQTGRGRKAGYQVGLCAQPARREATAPRSATAKDFFPTR